MQTQILRSANEELFRRGADESFSSLEALRAHCLRTRHESHDRWHLPAEVGVLAAGEHLSLYAGRDGEEASFSLNDWSFSQLCRLAGVGKETVNRLSAGTASAVFQETLSRTGRKPLQLFAQGDRLRSLHGTAYTRLFDAEVVEVAMEAASDFTPPQNAVTGGSGLYAGEQDLFMFLIDPTGWVEIEGEAFAPGFFLFNSEVGRRSLGVQTFWFQSVCQNHLVWDAVEVIDFSRKHTASVHEGLTEIRRIIERLVAQRDERRDSFFRVVSNAMRTRLGDDGEEVEKVLLREGIPRGAAKEALRLAKEQGRFTVFSLVDALTRLAGELCYAGDRTEADARASRLLALAA